MSAAADEGGALIAGDRCGVRSASARIGHGRDHVGRAAGSGNANHYVLARGTPPRDIALAQLLGVFIDLDRRRQRLGSAGHDVLHLARRGGIRGRTLRGIQSGNPPARPGPDVNQPPAVAQVSRHQVDYVRNLLDRLLHRRGHLGVLVVDDPGNLQCGLGVQPLGSLVLALRRQFLKQCGLVVIVISCSCARHLLQHSAWWHRVCPQLLL